MKAYTLFLLFMIVLIIYNTVDWRYYKLCRTENMDPFITQFMQTSRLDTEDKIIVVLWGDTDKMTPTVASLLDQTVRIDDIVIVSNTDVQLPEALTRFAHVIQTSCRYDTEFDDVRYIAQTTKDANTFILGLQSGTVYGKDFVRTMVEQSQIHPDEILSDGNGCIISRPDGVPLGNKPIEPSHIIKYSGNHKI